MRFFVFEKLNFVGSFFFHDASFVFNLFLVFVFGLENL
jgi:hypothetical protein